MARGLAKEIEAEADAIVKRNSQQAVDKKSSKGYYHSTVNAKTRRQRSPVKRNDKLPPAGTPFKKSVQLPDVTGLTSAVASPAKVDVEFYGYDPKETTETEGTSP